MPKTIVTHNNPDLDAIASVWLLKKFYADFKNAGVKFVPAGETLNGKPVDSDPDVMHVDTGLGRFDHHHLRERTCAAGKVLEFLLRKNPRLKDKEVLERLTELVIEDDNFEDCFWPEPGSDRYALFLSWVLDGLKKGGKADDQELINFGSKCLDGALAILKLKIEAEKEIRERGVVFKSRWGKAIGLNSQNDEVLKVAQRQGFILAVRKDPENNMVRIKARPQKGIDLTGVYEKLKTRDSEATWFLHEATRRMILNGSTKNPQMKPSKLSLKEVIEIIKEK